VGTHDPSPLESALNALWARFLPEINERVRLLESAAQAAAGQTLSSEQQEEAQSAAHKLAGVLGTFGLTRGTVLARELEMMYAQEGGSGLAQAEQLAQIAAELRTIVADRK
jgi:HPt (histidine-containing phosphotransfer) domain-containing protein